MIISELKYMKKSQTKNNPKKMRSWGQAARMEGRRTNKGNK